MKNNTDIRFEAFMQKAAVKGKTGIRLPLKEKDAEHHIAMLKTLLAKNMLSKNTYDESVKEIESRSLDTEMYQEFYELLKS
jgi:hypothetical protein